MQMSQVALPFLHPVRYFFGVRVLDREMIRLVKTYRKEHEFNLLKKPVHVPHYESGADIVWAVAYPRGDAAKVRINGRRVLGDGDTRADYFEFTVPITEIK